MLLPSYAGARSSRYKSPCRTANICNKHLISLTVPCNPAIVSPISVESIGIKFVQKHKSVFCDGEGHQAGLHPSRIIKIPHSLSRVSNKRKRWLISDGPIFSTTEADAELPNGRAAGKQRHPNRVCRENIHTRTHVHIRIHIHVPSYTHTHILSLLSLSSLSNLSRISLDLSECAHSSPLNLLHTFRFTYLLCLRVGGIALGHFHGVRCIRVSGRQRPRHCRLPVGAVGCGERDVSLSCCFLVIVGRVALNRREHERHRLCWWSCVYNVYGSLTNMFICDTVDSDKGWWCGRRSGCSRRPHKVCSLCPCSTLTCLWLTYALHLCVYMLWCGCKQMQTETPLPHRNTPFASRSTPSTPSAALCRPSVRVRGSSVLAHTTAQEC